MTDLDDLAAEWQREQLLTLPLAVDTGRRLHQSRSSLLWIGAFSVLFKLMTLGSAWLAWSGAPIGLPLLGVFVLYSIGFDVLWWQQRRRVQRAGELLTGPPSAFVAGRIELLEVERRAWDGPLSRLAVLTAVSMFAGCVLIGALIWPLLAVSSCVSLGVIVTVTIWGHRSRLPALDAELGALRSATAELRNPLRVGP